MRACRGKDHMMTEPRPRARGLQVIGALYAVSGGAFLLAFLSAGGGAALMRIGIPPTTFLLIPLGALLLVSGVGMLRHRAWARYLGLLIALSGIAVIGFRLLIGDEPAPLVPPLVTDVLVTAVLLGAWPRKGGLRPARGGEQR
jgi:hypothetical protein